MQRMYTFARMVPIQAPAANSKRTLSTRSSRMTLSRKLRISRESSAYDDVNGGPKAKSIADIDPWDVAQQLTLRLHYLYVSVPCDQMLFDLHSSPELTRFRAESERLQSMFVNHILICTEAKERAERIVHLMDVVDVLVELRSFHAVMLIVMALQSTPVHRLKQTWALVGTLWPRCCLFPCWLPFSHTCASQRRNTLAAGRTCTAPSAWAGSTSSPSTCWLRSLALLFRQSRTDMIFCRLQGKRDFDERPGVQAGDRLPPPSCHWRVAAAAAARAEPAGDRGAARADDRSRGR